MAWRHAALLLAFGLLISHTSAQSATETALQEAACFGSDENVDAASGIQDACSSLVASASSSASGVTIDCPADCAALFNQITRACRNSVAASASLGEAYRLIFDACSVPYTASASTPSAAAPLISLEEPSSGPDAPSTPLAPLPSETPIDSDAPAPSDELPPQLSGSLSDFECLTTGGNAAAAQRLGTACADIAPSADGTSLTCPASCSSALGDISQGCIDTIASSESLGTTYQFLFDSCNVAYSTTGNTTIPIEPSSSPATSPSGSPATSPSPSTTPTASPADTPSASPSSTPADSSTPTDAPSSETPAPTAEPTQAAARTATPAVLVALLTVLLALSA